MTYRLVWNKSDSIHQQWRSWLHLFCCCYFAFEMKYSHMKHCSGYSFKSYIEYFIAIIMYINLELLILQTARFARRVLILKHFFSNSVSSLELITYRLFSESSKLLQAEIASWGTVCDPCSSCSIPSISDLRLVISSLSFVVSIVCLDSIDSYSCRKSWYCFSNKAFYQNIQYSYNWFQYYTFWYYIGYEMYHFAVLRQAQHTHPGL